jgi:hypothetical protein
MILAVNTTSRISRRRASANGGPGIQPGPARVIGVLLLCGLWGISGCALFGSKQPPAQPLALGKWREDSLHCGGGECKRLYELKLDRATKVSISADAPADPRLPDFSLTLLDDSMRSLAYDSASLERPRKIARDLDAGVYYIAIEALGSVKDPLAYKLIATKLAKKKYRIKKSTTKPAPAPIPKPQPKLVRSEIIEVERSGGEPTAVLISMGTSDGIEPGLEAELVEGDTVIGHVKVVEVYAAGSRAQIVGGLSAPITLDTEVQLRR